MLLHCWIFSCLKKKGKTHAVKRFEHLLVGLHPPPYTSTPPPWCALRDPIRQGYEKSTSRKQLVGCRLVVDPGELGLIGPGCGHLELDFHPSLGWVDRKSDKTRPGVNKRVSRKGAQTCPPSGHAHVQRVSCSPTTNPPITDHPWHAKHD